MEAPPVLVRIVGLWLVFGILREGSGSPPPPALLAAARRADLELDPARMGIRDLRRLPGVGDGLALEVLRARREREDREGAGPTLRRWSDVTGIGPKTQDRIEAWIRARGGDPRRPLSGDQLLEQRQGGRAVVDVPDGPGLELRLGGGEVAGLRIGEQGR